MATVNGPDPELWVCISALWHRRFIEDALHFVGLPEGSRVRLRYRKPYVSPEVWNRVERNDVLKPVQVLFTVAATNSWGEDQFAPLRVAKVVGVQIQGNLLVVDCAVGGFVVENPIGSAWQELALELRNLPSNVSGVQRGDGWFVQGARRRPGALRFEVTVSAWERAADRLLEAHRMSLGSSAGETPLPFAYLIHDLPVDVGRRLRGSGQLEMESGATLELDIHTLAWSPEGRGIRNPLGEVRLDVSSEHARVITSKRVRVDSRRDVKRLRIEASPLFRSANGHVAVLVTQFEPARAQPTADALGTAESYGPAEALVGASDRREIVVARYDLGLHVGRWMPRWASLLVALAAAVASFKMPESSKSLAAGDFVVPTLVFVLLTAGLMLGLRGGPGKQ
jgi:hypothetical protein